MRPRIKSVQKISEAEITMCPGAARPRRNKAMMAHSGRMYTYVFGQKVYIQKGEVERFRGFEILFED